VGGGGGKLWRVGKVGLPVNTQIQAFYRERRGDMKRRTIAIALCAGVLASCAAKKPEPRPEPVAPARAATPPPALPSGTVGQETLTAPATVVNVNLKTRHVTQKDADGKKFTIVAGPEVRNLAQVKKGDVLRVRYRESIAYQVSKPGQAQPGAAATRDVSCAPLGAKPAGSVTNTVSVRATIAAIDKAHSEATLRGPQGKTTVVKVKDPSKLDAVQVGDRRCHLHRGACHRGREGRREIALRPRVAFVQAAEGASTASVGSASAGRSS